MKQPGKHSVLQSIRDFLSGCPNNKFLVAVSGGLDSMVLADALLKHTADFAIAHCNFHLRGKDSDEDQKLVEDWAASHGIVCHIGHFPLYDLKSGIQESARNARYQFFEELKAQCGYEILLTAHHRDDLQETFILNLIRGAGLRGLDVLSATDKFSLRPFRDLQKKEILEYALAQGIRWREDASNFKNDYARNKLRNQVFPILREIKPGLGSSMLQTMELISEWRMYVDQRLSLWKQEFIQQDAGRLLILPFPESEMPIFKYFAAGLGFNHDTIRQLTQAPITAGKSFHSSHGRTLRTARNYWVITEDSSADRQDEIIIRDFPVKVIFGNYEIAFKTAEAPVLEMKTPADYWSILADVSKLKFPIRLRRFIPGDRISTPGMQGRHKKLKKIFNEAGTDLQIRAELPVLESDGSILWVPGHAMSEMISNHGDSSGKMIWTCRRIQA